MRGPSRTSLLVGLVMGLTPAAGGAQTVEIHYAPVEDLRQIDIRLIESARLSIDLAIFSLRDPRVIEALAAAHARGVAVRIVLDPAQHQDYRKLVDLTDDVRLKRPGPLMHLKTYAIDGALLRTGSANLTKSGLLRQDNDLVVVRDRAEVNAFEIRFESVWDQARPALDDRRAVEAMQPSP